jgi:hypothetical protein
MNIKTETEFTHARCGVAVELTGSNPCIVIESAGSKHDVPVWKVLRLDTSDDSAVNEKKDGGTW